MRLLLVALPYALALRAASAGAAGSRPTEALKATVLVDAMVRRQERLHECARCWLPLDLCLCGRIQTGASRVDVVVAMHYKEFGKKKNTAKLLPLALPHDAQMVLHPTDTPALIERMRSSPSLLLWPGAGSMPASSHLDWVANVTAGEEERLLTG